MTPLSKNTIPFVLNIILVVFSFAESSLLNNFIDGCATTVDNSVQEFCDSILNPMNRSRRAITEDTLPFLIQFLKRHGICSVTIIIHPVDLKSKILNHNCKIVNAS